MIVDGGHSHAHRRRRPWHSSHDEVGAVIEGEVEVVIAVVENDTRVAGPELLREWVEALALLLLLGAGGAATLKGDGKRGVGK